MVSDILKSTLGTVLCSVLCRQGRESYLRNPLLVFNESLVQMNILSEIFNFKKNYQNVPVKFYQTNEVIHKIKISHILREI